MELKFKTKPITTNESIKCKGGMFWSSYCDFVLAQLDAWGRAALSSAKKHKQTSRTEDD